MAFGAAAKQQALRPACPQPPRHGVGLSPSLSLGLNHGLNHGLGHGHGHVGHLHGNRAQFSTERRPSARHPTLTTSYPTADAGAGAGVVEEAAASPRHDGPGPGLERIAKVLARSSLGLSRREADRAVQEHRVAVNGALVTTATAYVGPSDRVTVDGKLAAQPAANAIPDVYIAHKLPGELVTRSDPEGRPTMFERMAKMGLELKRALPRLKFVGRLDMNSEGLILLTSDGQLARDLELPGSGFERVYRVRVHGNVQEYKLDQIKRGVTVDGVRYRKMDVAFERGRANAGTNKWLKFTCREGKNRQIRKVCDSLGMDVNRLIRDNFGPFSLKGIPRGGVLKVPENKVRRLLEASKRTQKQKEVRYSKRRG